MQVVRLEPGRRLDRYTLVAPVGEGGQGTVWRVQDPLNPDARLVAKLVGLEDVSATDAERMRAEARALARLGHPSLVVCHALFEDLRENVLGLVLDEVEGRSLDGMLAEGLLSQSDREAILGHVAKVLSYVHAQGLVHRDLKPENILISDDFARDPGRADTVKLVDFGIAVLGGNPRPLTRTGFTPGTVPFMPPEHIDPSYWNAPASLPTADVWAFGVLGWIMLAGCHPTGLGINATIVDFGARYRACLEGQMPWPVGTVVGAWGSVLSCCLSLRAGGRPANGSAILARAKSGTATHQPPPLSIPGSGRTEPMGRGPLSTSAAVVSPPTVPMSPASAALRSPGRAVTRGSGQQPKHSGIAIGTALVVTLAVLLFAWPLLRTEGASAVATGTAGSPTRTATATATSTGRTKPPDPIRTRPEAPSTPPVSTCDPCCGGSDCVAALRADGALPPGCASEGRLCGECSSRFRTCVRYSCNTPLGSQLAWKLRISYVADSEGVALWKTSTVGRMCIDIAGGSRTCFPISALASRGGLCWHRPSITTDDIASGRVSVSFDVPGKPPVSVPLTHPTLGPGGLCIGWRNSATSWIKTVGWFLDPPSDPDADCEREERARPR